MNSRVQFDVGRWFFGLAVVASGALQLVIGDFVRLIPRPTWLLAPTALAYASGALVVAIGLAILTGKMSRPAASLLGALLFFSVFVLYPSQFQNPQIDTPWLRGFMYTNPLKCFALIGGAALLAARLPGPESPLAPLVRLFVKVSAWSAVLLAAFLSVCGIQHFWYAQFVDTLVPAWIPPSQRFWTLFAGVALVAGGVGLLAPRTARLAAALSSLMIFLWVLMLHIPRAIGEANHANETAGVFEALALSGVCLLVAGTRDRRSEGAAS